MLDRLVLYGVKQLLPGVDTHKTISVIINSKMSLLSPLLYLVYVDMMCVYLQDTCITSFADGMVLTVFAKSVDDLIVKAQNALKRLEVFTSLSLLC